MSDGPLANVFGRVSWAPPPWLVRLGPRRVLALLFTLAFFALLALALGHYAQSRPKPPTLVPEVTPPGLSAVSDDALTPAPLLIAFAVAFDPRVPGEPITSVAALDALSKESLDGVRLDPVLPGRWRWQDERTLRFEPAQDWPANQDYTVRYDAALFAPNLAVGRGAVTFTTPAFAATLDALEFYQDPVVADERKVVATLGFTHPVSEAALQDKLRLARRAAGQTVADEAQPVEFSVRMGPQGRSAFVHSARLELPEAEVYLGFTLDAGLAPLAGNATLDEPLTGRVRIPDRASYFRVDNVRAQLVRDENNDPVQTVSLAFTDRVASEVLNPRIELYRLPRHPTIDGAVVRNKYWQSPREVTADVLAQAQRVNATLNDVEGAAARLHSLRLNQPDGATLYLKIGAGLTSTGEFVMGQPYDALVRLPQYPKEASVAREGGLLPLTGSHELTLIGRGVATLRIDVRRVQDGALHHLVSQTEGDIRSPAFRTWHFDENNLTDRSERYLNLNAAHPARASYAQLDMSEFLPDGGVFLVRVQGWDRQRQRAVGSADQRLVLITDLGLLAKRNADGSQDVFVHRLSSGVPASGVRVLLLGRNGRPVLDEVTDASGHVATTSLNGLGAETEPTVWLARDGSDSVFMPFQRHDRRLQYSRFDVGGDYASADAASDVRAFAFTDRGLYRPGETVRIAAVVKRGDWGALDALPVVLRVYDPRGAVVHEHRERLASDGLIDRAFATEAVSPTGNYNAVLLVVDGRQRETHLGNVAFRVEEFQPDRLRMSARIDGAGARGWVKPGDLSLAVQLDTLFGAPAQDRRIAASMTLEPSGIRLADFEGFRFDDPLRRDDAPLTRIREVLPDARTDQNGAARLPLDLARYAGGIYRLSVDVAGFEAGDGRSVRARTGVMMSPLDALVGYRSASDLTFLDRDSAHSIEFVAVGADGQAIALDGLRQRLSTYRNVSTLVQRPNGTYAYQSVRKDSVVSEAPFSLPAGITGVSVPTAEPGQYALALVDASDRVLASVDFTVAGARNVAGRLERDAQLELVLNGDSFGAGDEIELQITAPYTGTGLITIERDRVYAHRWFTADTATSVQRIRVPPGLEGNAYVNVAFVRDLASPEVFVSPLSYAVAPFAIDRAARSIDVSLAAPELTRPGEPMRLTYSASRPSRVLLFAVDEGILQTAGYQTPDPLAFFLRKLALQVGTYQMVDLILPEFDTWARRFAPGGGDGMDLVRGNLNPFRRRDEAPVAFWSGVLDAGPDARSVEWIPPDYFNGQVRVMAVAVNDAAAGHAQTRAIVRAPFVITPNVLTAATAGDEFELTVAVSNQLEGSGADVPVNVAVAASNLMLANASAQTLALDEGEEGRVALVLRAGEYGPAHITITASSGATSVSRRVSLSVRPSMPYERTVRSGIATRLPADVPLERALESRFSEQRISASASPLVLVDGLLDYLDVFPHDCAEQMTSKVFPQIGLLGHPAFDVNEADIRTSFAALLARLRSRQLPGGGFSFWPGANEPAAFASVYILHFLADAAERGLPVPRAMRTAGRRYLQEQSVREVSTLAEARVRAYAIYVLTRDEVVTSGPATDLHEWLDQNHPEAWRRDTAGSLLAATYKLLKQDALADPLMAAYAYGGGDETYSDFDTRLSRDAQHVYLLARHFPEQAAQLDAAALSRLIEPVMQNRFNTLSSAFTVLALGELTRAQPALPELTIDWVGGDGVSGAFARAELPHGMGLVTISGDTDRDVYYVTRQSGYDSAPVGPTAEGLELVRDYLNAAGEVVEAAQPGDELTVRLRIRALGAPRDNVVITDLLPGGAEVLTESVTRNFGGWSADYVDVREDRVVIYGRVGTQVTEIRYRVKLTTTGVFERPTALAESMYDTSVRARTGRSSPLRVGTLERAH